MRKTSFEGCEAIVSCDGEVIFYDPEGNELGRAGKSDRQFEQVRPEYNFDLSRMDVADERALKRN